FATDSSKKQAFSIPPFDLHVLGMPPAFILSQDQTLHCLSVSFFYAVVSSVFSFFIRTSIGPSELTFPVWFSKIGLAFPQALVYITIHSLFVSTPFFTFSSFFIRIAESYQRLSSPSSCFRTTFT